MGTGRFVKNPKLRDLHWSTAVQTLAVAEEAVQQFDYEAATKLTGIAINVGKRTKQGAPGDSKILPNAGTTRFLPDGVNFAKASVVKLQGRGEVRVIPALDRITIEFHDGEVGGDTYEVLVLFAE